MSGVQQRSTDSRQSGWFVHYPDGSVVFGKPVIAEKYTLLNPRILIEVLSKTTESNDRGIKRQTVKTLLTVR